MSSKQRFFYFFLLGLIILVIIVLWALNNEFAQRGSHRFNQDAQNQMTSGQVSLSQTQATSQTQQNLIQSSLNGALIPLERAKLPVIAVMIENSPLARWQSGLSKADIVYETLAEGGITRFMALFQGQEAETVGPVRSARIYYAEIVREYDAWYSHVGGAPDALTFIANNAIHNLDQFFLDKPYYRDPIRQQKRGLEHSMYTNTNDLRAYVAGSLKSTFAPWQFQPEEAKFADRGKPQTIKISFSSPEFDVKWNYDPTSNTYLRTNGGETAVDAQNSENIKAHNVLVQYVGIIPALDVATGAMEAVSVQLTGKGTGVLFRDGKTIAVTWSKAKSGERTKYFDVQGKEVLFNPGQIWVELAAKWMVSYK